MSFASLMNKSVVIQRRSTSSTNDYNEPVYTLATVATINAAFQHFTMRNLAAGEPGDLTTLDGTLYCPFDTDIKVDDEVTVDSVTYHVVSVGNISGRDHHKEVICKHRGATV